MSKRAPQTHHPLWHDAPVRHYMYTLRKQLGLSIESLAAESGYAKGTINAIERGYLAPDFIQLAEIAQCLGMRVSLLPIPVTQSGDVESKRCAAVREEQSAA